MLSKFRIIYTITVIFLVSIYSTNMIAASGKITGKVFDKTTKEPLPGCNVVIKGTVIGTATNYEGSFTITNLSTGKYTLVASYLGYNEKKIAVNVEEGRKTYLEIELEYGAVESEEVIITAQARGQLKAINQQISARSIKNIVSEDKIKELPDANAAEALGRLPGVAINREGGEASSVVIRGQSGGSNTVYVEGMRMSGVDGDGNSRGVGMANISSQMIGGIELQKSFTPDNDADVKGGGVNFRLKEAQNGLHADIFLRQGYNNFSKSFKMNDISLSLSNRFFDNKLGVIANYSFDQKDRSTDFFNALYYKEVPENPDSIVLPNTPSAGLVNKIEMRKRHGLTFNIDYLIPSGKIKAKGFIANMDRAVEENRNTFSNRTGDKSVRYTGSRYSQNEFSSLYGLSGEHNFFSIKADWNLYYSKSVLERPDEIGIYASRPGGDVHLELNESPESIILKNNSNVDLDMTTFATTRYAKAKNNASEIGFQLDIEVPVKISSFLDGYIKFGGKHRKALRDYRRDGGYLNYGPCFKPNGLKALREAFPDWDIPINPEGGCDIVGYSLFVKDIEAHDFGGNDDLKFYFPADFDKIDRAINAIKKRHVNDLQETANNYDNRELFSAGYIMTGIDIGTYATFTPGIRYEVNENKTDAFYYKQFAHAIGSEDNIIIGEKDPVSAETKNEFWLPMYNLKIKPANWLDIRAAVSTTLYRAGFQDYSPRVYDNPYIAGVAIRKGNPDLEPEISKNYDLYFSFYEDHIGLFTIGGFIKKIKNQIRLYQATMHDPEQWGYDSQYKGNIIQLMVNNKWDVDIKGVEVDWQTNFWYLPEPLNGLVLNVNYTHMVSETMYPFADSKLIWVNWQPVKTHIDSFRVTKALGSPDDFLKLSLGYESGGFSGRISLTYQSSSLSWMHPDYRTLNRTKDELFRWDMQLSQQIFKNLKLYLNVNNLNNWPDRSLMTYHTDRRTLEQTYGVTGDIGLRYRL